MSVDYSWVINPIAAAGAVFPVFHGFRMKSALQLNLPPPAFSFMAAARTAPTIGATIGFQFAARKWVQENVTPSPEISSVLVAGASIPFLVVFNGQSMDQTALASLKNITPRLGLALLAQETIFIGTDSYAEKASGAAKKRFGNNPFVDYGSTFLTGVAGSLLSHPANTTLTCIQGKEKVRGYMKGAFPRAMGVGAFLVLYRINKELIFRMKLTHHALDNRVADRRAGDDEVK